VYFNGGSGTRKLYVDIFIYLGDSQSIMHGWMDGGRVMGGWGAGHGRMDGLDTVSPKYHLVGDDSMSSIEAMSYIITLYT
jgi:hypothetical protein